MRSNVNDWMQIANATTIRVNCAAEPKLPFADAVIDSNIGGSWVTVQAYPDGLYVDGVKIIPHLEEGQKDRRSIQGYKLHSLLGSRKLVHPNIIDAAVECDFMPKDWSMDQNGKPQNIVSFAVVFRGLNGHRYVRSWFSCGGRWASDFKWLGSGWCSDNPSLVLDHRN